MTSTLQDDTSKEINITNNAKTDIIVLMPTTGEAPCGLGSTKVYGMDLYLLNSIDNQTTISVGDNKTYVLDLDYKDPKTGVLTYSPVYNLIIGTSNWYYPVANIGVMQNFIPPGFDPQTVTQADQKSIQDAATFFQTISAYPTSKLAQDYLAAMSATQQQASNSADGSPNSANNVANSISGNVNNFFQSTKGFQDVTLSSLVAIQSYYDNFVFVWAEYKSTTYYLYSSDGSSTSFVGTIAITMPVVLDLTLPQGGYNCLFSPAKNPSDTTKSDVDTSQSKNLIYSDGLLVDSVEVDIPQIAVKGTFQVKRLFTQVTTDTQIITVLTGSIDGATCIGFDAPQLSNDKSNSEFWNTLFHPKNSSQIFQSVMTIGGAIMMLHFFATTLWTCLQWVRGLAKAKEPVTSDKLKEENDKIEVAENAKVESTVSKTSNGKEQAPESPEAAANEIATQRDAITDNLNSANIQDGLDAQAANLEELAKFESEMNAQQIQSLEANATSIKSSSDALNDATPDTLHDVVQIQTNSLIDIQTNIGDLTTEMNSSLSEAAKSNISENQKVSEEASETIESANENRNAEENDFDPKAEDPIIPEF